MYCHGDSVLFGDEWRKASGDYTAVFENSLGCDSTVTLHLTVRDEIRYEYSGILCSGGVYSDENFANLTEGGDHVVTLTSATGCDSIVTLHLTEKTIAPSFIDEEICDGESYTFGDASYNTTGEYPYTFTSVDGCDSLGNAPSDGIAGIRIGYDLGIDHIRTSLRVEAQW